MVAGLGIVLYSDVIHSVISLLYALRVRTDKSYNLNFTL